MEVPGYDTVLTCLLSSTNNNKIVPRALIDSGWHYDAEDYLRNARQLATRLHVPGHVLVPCLR